MRHDGVVGAREARDRVEQDDDVALVLDEPLGLLDHHVGDLHVARRGLVEGRGDHLALHVALHVGHLFGPLVDQQHDQVDLGMVLGDRVGDVLQDHRLAGLGRRRDQRALPFPERRDQVDDAAGEDARRGLELELLFGIERRQVVEVDAVAELLGRVEVDRLDLEQREVALAVLGRTDLAADRIAGAQAEAADLRRRHVDVVGARRGSSLRRSAGSRSRRAASRARLPRRSCRGSRRWPSGSRRSDPGGACRRRSRLRATR